MKKLMMKARSGVTLVELLVVILIVTILSVSMLPLLKPFVVEAQYAAEAIPVIGNLRTKIGLFQYDKGKLPTIANAESGTYTNVIETWCFTENGTAKSQSETSLFAPAVVSPLASGVMQGFNGGASVIVTTPGDVTSFFGNAIDVDNQDLAGKRCKPVHYQYLVVANGSSYCYIIGCFGDNHGLPNGTGYAVCEINVKGTDGNVYKHIGTWKRYKAATDEQILFGSVTGAPAANEMDAAKKASPFCAVPAPSLFPANGCQVDGSGNLTMIGFLENWGWEF